LKHNEIQWKNTLSIIDSRVRHRVFENDRAIVGLFELLRNKRRYFRLPDSFAKQAGFKQKIPSVRSRHGNWNFRKIVGTISLADLMGIVPMMFLYETSRENLQFY
jgi:hypothetical protein